MRPPQGCSAEAREGAAAVQRMTIPVGKKFDAENPAHVDAALKVAAEGGHGTGWKVQSFDSKAGMLTLWRQSAVTTVTREDGGGDSYRVGLERDTKLSDGEAIASRLESDPAHEGYYMTRFEPFNGRATMTKLTDSEVRARSAIATVLGVKPWDVQVKATTGGGFDVKLPQNYVPSRHDDKLDEIAQVAIGKPGWYFTGDAAKLTGKVVPSTPPTFPSSIPYPFSKMPTVTPGVLPPIPIGVCLPERGDKQGDPIALDTDASPHTQVGGTSGAGKSVLLNIAIAGALAGGAELVILDVPAKAIDFDAWRPFVRRGGWGCESFQEGAIVLEQLYKEGNERAATLKRYGAKKVGELPRDIQLQMKPVFIVVDEVTGMFSMDTVPKSLPDDHPLRLEASSKNLAKELIRQYLEKIAAELRFVGYRLVISTQVASTSTGISTAFRTNLGNKALLGARATDGNRKLILRDPSSAPQVPDHVKFDSNASRGVGVSEFEGRDSRVFKSYFATERDLIAHLATRGVSPRTTGVETFTRPDPQLVAAMFPELATIAEAEKDANATRFGASPRELESWEVDPATGKPLTGFARANAARAQLTVVERNS